METCHVTHLLCHFGARAQLEKSACERRGRLEVLDLEEEVEGGTQSEDEVDGLEAAVGEVGSHL